MKLSNKDLDKISLQCYAIAVHHISMFYNPKMTGKNFTWEKFPEMLAEFCRNYSFLICENEKKKKAYEDHAYKTGLEIGKQSVKWMTED